MKPDSSRALLVLTSLILISNREGKKEKMTNVAAIFFGDF